MHNDERQKYLQTVTRKLVIFTLISVIILSVGAYTARNGERTFLVLIVFMLGLLGGFVSIQQRLPSIEADELKLLSDSWHSILMIPVNGGIFAVVLMLMFLSGLIEGEMFPKFYRVPFDTSCLAAFKDSVMNWFQYTFPQDSHSMGKLLFWSFVAGFSERFVPQIIRTTTTKVTGTGEQDNPPVQKENNPLPGNAENRGEK
ncbi:MAG: hypothetical protein D3904_03705 [Candidatus Electrothrix sp. EH2]|nr:hypothetical protein [Candidatus Electrothrix sp. EH2]